MSQANGKSLRRALAQNFGSFRVADFSRNKGSRRGEVYVLDSFKHGERRLFKHKHGHVLASEKIVKPLVHDKRSFLMFDCEEVKFERKAEYTITTAKALDVGILEEAHETVKANATLPKAARRSTGLYSDPGSVSSKPQKVVAQSRRAKLREKGHDFFVMDNNNLRIFSTKALKNASKIGTLAKSNTATTNSTMSLKIGSTKSDRTSLEPCRCFSWSHIYAVERAAGSTEFQIVFYSYLDEDNLPNEGHFASKAFQFTVVTVKLSSVEEATEMMTAMYKAIEGQAIMCSNTAKNLVVSTNLNAAEAAEDFIRLSVDLWALSEGCASQRVIDAQTQLIDYLKAHEDPDNEAAFWQDQKKELEDELNKLTLDSEAVDGFQI